MMKLILVGFCLFSICIVLYHCYLKREKKKKFDTKYYDVDYHVGDTLVEVSGRVLSDTLVVASVATGDKSSSEEEDDDLPIDDRNRTPLRAWMTSYQRQGMHSYSIY